MANLDPNLSSIRSDSNPNLIQGQPTNGGVEPANVPRPITPAERPAQPLNLQHRVVPVQENRTSGFFRYYFGPLFGLLTPAESNVVQNVETRIARLERIFSAQREVISRRTNIGVVVTRVGQANSQAAMEIGELDALEGEIRSLANNYARYSGIPERITELKRKKSRLATQYQIGMLLSSYHGAVQTYAIAVRDRGIADSWEAFVQARASMQDVAGSLLNAIRSNPDLNNDSKIQKLIRGVQGSKSQALPIIKLMRHVYPQYEKELAKLFNDTVNISKQRIADLKQRRNNLKPLLEQHHAQSLEANRLTATRDDQGLLSGYVRAFHQYRYGETVDETLARVQQNLANISQTIDINRLSNHDELEWLRTVAQTSKEARAVYDSLTPVIADSYKILSMTEANYGARREELSAALDLLIAELGRRDLNGSNIAHHLSEVFGKIIAFRRDADVVALPVNYNILSNLQKVEVLVKLYFPALETKAANLILRVNKRGLTALFNETISLIVQRRRNEEQADRVTMAPVGIVQPLGEVPEGEVLRPDDLGYNQPAVEVTFEMLGEQEEPLILVVEPPVAEEEERIPAEVQEEPSIPVVEPRVAEEEPAPPAVQEIELLQANLDEEIQIVDPLAAQLLNPVLPEPPPADFIPPPPAPPLPPPTSTVSASRPTSTSTPRMVSASDLQRRASLLRRAPAGSSPVVGLQDDGSNDLLSLLNKGIQQSSRLLPAGSSNDEDLSDADDSEGQEWFGDENKIKEDMLTRLRSEKARLQQETEMRRADREAAQRSEAVSSTIPSSQPTIHPPESTSPTNESSLSPDFLKNALKVMRSKRKGTKEDWDKD